MPGAGGGVVARSASRATFSREVEGAASDAAETYSAVCFLSSATSFAVSFEPFAPNRAVT
jgi:hypothetical protein